MGSESIVDSGEVLEIVITTNTSLHIQNHRLESRSAQGRRGRIKIDEMTHDLKLSFGGRPYTGEAQGLIRIIMRNGEGTIGVFP